MTSVTVQRWISDQQRELFCKFFKPLMEQSSGWLVYEIDDNMSDLAIPKYNRGRQAFVGEKIQNNIRQMLNAADFVTVTTDYLKESYHRLYGVPYENMIAIPNFLPKYLFGDRYRPEEKLEQFKKNKNRPRIGIVSSLSHYNVDNVREDDRGKACRLTKREDGSEAWLAEDNVEVPFENTRPIEDDIDEIMDCIRSTVDQFQWVFFGYCPPKLEDLRRKGKIEYHGGVPIYNYPGVFDNLKLQAVVAAITKTEFNFCKSFIKTMECAALGVPCFATNCEPYSRVMPAAQLFDTGDELKEKLAKLKFSSSGVYHDIIQRQWQWLNTPHDEGDFTAEKGRRIKNFWLEDNLNVWIDLFRLRQKGMTVSLRRYVQQREERARQEEQNTIARNDNISITK